MNWLVSTAFIALSVTASVTAAAQDREKQACVDAFEKAQVHRAHAQFTAAKELLPICTRPVCPVLVQQECAALSSEVHRALPSLVVAVRDAKGRDLLTARVAIDGKQKPDGIAGKPMPLDPGVHTIRVEADGMTPAEERLVIREGDRGRPYTISLHPLEHRAVAAEAEPPRKPETDVAKRPFSPLLAYALIGAGAVAVGTGVALDLSSAADVRRMRNSCAPDCGDNEITAAKQKYVAALAIGGVGLTAAALGTVLLLTRSKPALPQETGVQVAPTKDGVAAFWRGRF